MIRGLRAAERARVTRILIEKIRADRMARCARLAKMDQNKFKAQYRDIRTRRIAAKLRNQRRRESNRYCNVQPLIIQSGIDVLADAAAIVTEHEI